MSCFPSRKWTQCVVLYFFWEGKKSWMYLSIHLLNETQTTTVIQSGWFSTSIFLKYLLLVFNVCVEAVPGGRAVREKPRRITHAIRIITRCWRNDATRFVYRVTALVHRLRPKLRAASCTTRDGLNPYRHTVLVNGNSAVHVGRSWRTPARY